MKILRLGLIAATLTQGVAAGTPEGVSPIESPDAITGANAVSVDFTYFSPGSSATRLLATFGVSIPAYSDASPLIVNPGESLDPPAIAGWVYNVDGEAGVPLILDFSIPVRRIGLTLQNGPLGSRVTLRALDARGDSMGSVESTFPEGFGHFFGIQTTTETAISKLIVDYDSESIEQVSRLVMEYASELPFRSYIAQVANSSVGGFELRTQLVLTNPTEREVRAKLLVFGQDGSELNLHLNGETGSAFEFQLPAFGSVRLSTGGTDSAVGYARVESDGPVDASAVFQLFEEGSLHSEAGFSGSSGTFRSTIAAQRLVDPGLDTGLAIVNTADEGVTLDIILFGRDGSFLRRSLELSAGAQRALFLSELFSHIKEDLEGVLVITARAAPSGPNAVSVPLAVTAVRTFEGFVRSSLPIATTESVR